MNEIGSAIRNTRTSLKKTMAEFARMIGCKQSTVSRYESGRLIPSRAVLMLLLRLAKGADREVILQSLGADCETWSGWDERELLDALKTFEDYLGITGDEARRGQATRAGPVSPVVAFAKAAKQVLLERPEPDPAVAAVLQYWIRHRGNPKAREYFRHVAAYLDVELTVLEAGDRKKSPARRGKPVE